jgi:hypothetical protein
VKAPTCSELDWLVWILALRIGQYLESEGILEWIADNSNLGGVNLADSSMEQLLGSSIIYRIAVGQQQGRNVFKPQSLPVCAEPFGDGVSKLAGFSLRVVVSVRVDKRKKHERMCLYISAGRKWRKSA